MLIRLAVLAAVVGGAFGVTSSAHAASVCVELHVNVNGTPVDQAQCVELPALPA